MRLRAKPHLMNPGSSSTGAGLAAMRHLFTFFFRLLFTFLAAKLLVTLAGLPGLNTLVVLTFLLLANVYFFDYLDYRSHSSWRRPAARPPGTAIPLPASPPEAPPET